MITFNTVNFQTRQNTTIPASRPTVGMSRTLGCDKVSFGMNAKKMLPADLIEEGLNHAATAMTLFEQKAKAIKRAEKLKKAAEFLTGEPEAKDLNITAMHEKAQQLRIEPLLGRHTKKALETLSQGKYTGSVKIGDIEYTFEKGNPITTSK